MDLLPLLRQRTREQHARLDAALDFRAGTMSRERYVAFLRGVLGVVSAVEPALAVWLGPAGGPSRTCALRADLGRLGVPHAPEERPVRLPRNEAEAYGCAYVLEGSALGGLVLAPAIAERLGATTPAAYLCLRGSDTTRAWRDFLERLRAFGERASAGDAHAACDIACTTFDAYAASLRASGATFESCVCTP